MAKSLALPLQRALQEFGDHLNRHFYRSGGKVFVVLKYPMVFKLSVTESDSESMIE